MKPTEESPKMLRRVTWRCRMPILKDIQNSHGQHSEQAFLGLIL